MIINVSISQFRQNVAKYIAKARDGNLIILEDGKRGKQIAQISGRKDFDSDAFIEALRNAAGVFTGENHPEWTTKKQIIKWLEKERSSFDRSF